MKRLGAIVWLEWAGLVRTHTVTLLLAGALGWTLLAPLVLRADGTDAGARAMSVTYALGGSAVLVAVALTMSAAGSVSRERVACRLPLTLVRPVPLVWVALGKMVAHVAVAALALGLCAGVEAVRQDTARPCRHVYRPVLPSPADEAQRMYAAYMAHPETPEAVRKASRGAVLRLLEQRARDRYQIVATNGTARWTFAGVSPSDAVSVRMRFTNDFGMRDDVRGQVRFGTFAASIANLTQAVVEVPLVRGASAGATGNTLVFENAGPKSVMLRPRQDVELLVTADGFGWNLARAALELLALVSLLVGFGVFLGSGLGRPVALFVAAATLALGEMSPAVIDRYPDQLEVDRADALGLAFTRLAAGATRPLSAVRPLSALAADECIEGREVGETLLLDMLLLPGLFALLSAWVMRRRTTD